MRTFNKREATWLAFALGAIGVVATVWTVMMFIDHR
jgi:hypothetical protein